MEDVLETARRQAGMRTVVVGVTGVLLPAVVVMIAMMVIVLFADNRQVTEEVFRTGTIIGTAIILLIILLAFVGYCFARRSPRLVRKELRRIISCRQTISVKCSESIFSAEQELQRIAFEELEKLEKASTEGALEERALAIQHAFKYLTSPVQARINDFKEAIVESDRIIAEAGYLLEHGFE